MKIAIIGAGWAGLAAATTIAQAGHRAIIFEASRTIGGRARAIKSTLPDGTPIVLDNGQHILIGAYTQTLRLMHQVGVSPEQTLLRLPMTLVFPQGQGLRLPPWPTPLDALAGIVRNRAWTVSDKWSLLRAATGWQWRRFRCDPCLCVAELCQGLAPRIISELIEPLCVSALNTPAQKASAQVFLRVIQDALFGVQKGSNLLLPRADLSEIFPDAAIRWVIERGGELRMATRVESVQQQGAKWKVQGEPFDAVILATSATEAARTLEHSRFYASNSIEKFITPWVSTARALQYEAIATVYAWAPHASLTLPMLTLRSAPESLQHMPSPAQFVFDRGQLGGPKGLLAFVASASLGERELLQTQVLAQAELQLGLKLQAVKTIVEKRATFACTPSLQRPTQHIMQGLMACGDYVEGPYPATLEGAVRSGISGAAGVLQPD